MQLWRVTQDIPATLCKLIVNEYPVNNGRTHVNECPVKNGLMSLQLAPLYQINVILLYSIKV